MPNEDELWAVVAGHREGILTTIGPSGRPQMSNVLYMAEPGTRLVRISTTAERVKAKNLARDPRASLHVAGADFWHFAVAEGSATLSRVAAAPGDPAVVELAEVHAAFYGDLDSERFAAEVIAAHRLVVRLQIDHLYGLLADGARRPRAESTSAKGD